jgi:hypothetical protein
MTSSNSVAELTRPHKLDAQARRALEPTKSRATSPVDERPVGLETK